MSVTPSPLKSPVTGIAFGVAERFLAEDRRRCSPFEAAERPVAARRAARSATRRRRSAPTSVGTARRLGVTAPRPAGVHDAQVPRVAEHLRRAAEPIGRPRRLAAAACSRADSGGEVRLAVDDCWSAPAAAAVPAAATVGGPARSCTSLKLFSCECWPCASGIRTIASLPNSVAELFDRVACCARRRNRRWRRPECQSGFTAKPPSVPGVSTLSMHCRRMDFDDGIRARRAGRRSGSSRWRRS